MVFTGGAAARSAAPLFLSAALVAGCSSTRDMSAMDLLGQGPVFREARPGAAREVRAGAERVTAAEADAAASLAEEQLASGDPAAALETVRGTLLRSPPDPESSRLRSLRAAAKKALLSDTVVRCELEPALPRITEGDRVPVRIRLRNLAPVPLTVRAPGSGVSPTLVRVSVTRRAYDVYGNTRTDTWTESVPFDPGEAPAGGSLETAFAFETERFRSIFPRGFVEYALGGTVLPSGMTAGDSEVHERIPVAGALVASFPRRWEEVAADPAKGIEDGLARGNPVRVLVGAACTAPADRARAGARLAARLRQDPPLAEAMESGVRAAVRWLAGDADADRWGTEEWDRMAAALRPPEGPK